MSNLKLRGEEYEGQVVYTCTTCGMQEMEPLPLMGGCDVEMESGEGTWEPANEGVAPGGYTMSDYDYDGNSITSYESRRR